MEKTEEVVSNILSMVGDMFMIVIAIMCAILFAAIVVLWIVDHLKEIKDRNDKKSQRIAELEKRVKELETDRNTGYEKNSDTAEVADKIFDMYLTEKSRGDDLERQWAQWDSARLTRISALEKQLIENGIQPIKWEEIKFAA